MQKPKYYIPEYYIKNISLSFLGLVVLAGLFELLVNSVPPAYENVGVSLVILIMALGIIVIGYWNALSAKKLTDQRGSSLLLHALLCTGLLITDLSFGESSLLMTLLRNVGYFLCLELGAYIHRKWKIRNVA